MNSASIQSRKKHFSAKSTQNQLPKWLMYEVTISLAIGLIYFGSSVLEAETAKEVWAEIWFSLNYIAAIGVINYVLHPRFFNLRFWWVFLITGISVLLLVVVIEEKVIEGIFYPSSRGGDPLNLDSIEHVLFDFLPVFLFFFCFRLIWTFQKEQHNLNALRREKAESELKFLRSQLNPHILFNNLNNIYSYSLDGSPRAPEMIMKLSNLMRYMLYECEEQVVPLRKEIDYLSDYIELQKTQLEERGTIRLQLIGELEGYRIAPLLLIAFVENCFKHSMQTQVFNIEIDITIRMLNGTLDFFAENTYSEASEVSELPGGIGLANVRKRLELIYPEHYELHTGHKDERYWVSLRIELL